MTPAHAFVTEPVAVEPVAIEVAPSADEHGSAVCCTIVAPILSRVGDKWSMLIVMLLRHGPLRFNELKRRVGTISQRMLSLTLRGLERDGLVDRTVTPSVPPRVDYALSALGASLAEPVQALGAWAQANHAAIAAAQSRFDTKGRG